MATKSLALVKLKTHLGKEQAKPKNIGSNFINLHPDPPLGMKNVAKHLSGLVPSVKAHYSYRAVVPYY